jgi:signal peptidase I
MGFLLVFLFLLVAVVYCFSTELIPSGSMLPTLKPGDQILTMRAWIAYPGGAMPARGDIVLFHSTNANAGNTGQSNDHTSPRKIGIFHNEGDLLIKRVVGLPGETVEFLGDDVFINGLKQRRDYEITPWTRDVTEGNFYENGAPVKLGPDEIYVLGDNRDNSDDSRYWGPLKRTHVTGKFIRVLLHRNLKTEAPAAGPTGQ